MVNTKKFVDRKKSWDYKLFYRDHSDPNYYNPDGTENERVFIRSHYEQLQTPGPLDNLVTSGSSNRIFDDAEGDEEGGGGDFGGIGGGTDWEQQKKRVLTEKERKEILELGFPDDGYNYLLHLRAIRSSAEDSSFYENKKAQGSVAPDVKAYDASKLQIHVDESNAESVCKIAPKIRTVKPRKVIDDEVAALLDGRFSDVEEEEAGVLVTGEIEDDFLMLANQKDENDEEEEEEDVVVSKNSDADDIQKSLKGLQKEVDLHEEEDVFGDSEYLNLENEEKPRARRLLDEQFDLLTLKEYDTDEEDMRDFHLDVPEGELAMKLNDALKGRVLCNLDHSDENLEPLEAPEEIKQKCAEYAELYSVECPSNVDDMLDETSSSESEQWDCESVVSTYSNLDNHPSRIGAPGRPRRTFATTDVKTIASNDGIIALRGKHSLPVSFLPQKKESEIDEKPKAASSKWEVKTRQLETKTEKKARKAAVKDERRVARQAKKECRVMFKGEAMRGKQVFASSGPSGIHLP